MVDLGQALTLAIGRAALAKHLESCSTCTEDVECAVARAHRRTLASVTSPATCTERGCFADDPPCYSDPSCARVLPPGGSDA